MDEPLTQMREFIMVTESLNQVAEPIEEPQTITESLEPVDTIPLHELMDVVFKLRAFMESSDGDFALGVETGMQRAADMIENAIRRHRQGE